MLNALQLKDITFPINIIQGPLAGVSNSPFRRLIWKYSQPAYTCTEMISCKTLNTASPERLKRFTHIADDEGAVCFQLSGNDPHELGEAVKRATDCGATLIDLNCGCPVKKIRSKGAGSRLLQDPLRLYQLITTMKQNTSVPISIKIRVDSQTDDRFNQTIAQVVQEAGADVLVVHGRNWREHYETPCRYDDIKFFVDAVSIPVIGNGDIACLDSLKKMLTTGCQGVMIARAGVGQPWLVAKLIAEIQQQTFHTPTSKEIATLFLEHVNTLSTLLNSEKFAIIEARKLAKYYARGMQNKMAFCEQVNTCEDRVSLEGICAEWF